MELSGMYSRKVKRRAQVFPDTAQVFPVAGTALLTSWEGMRRAVGLLQLFLACMKTLQRDVLGNSL